MQLFQLAKTEQVAYVISPFGDQAELYYFTGRILGKAVFENIPVYCPLSKVLYKHLLELQTDFEDLKYLDTELHSSLVCIADNSIDNMFIGYFALEKGSDMYELIKNGSEISITEENKERYIQLRTRFETISSMEPGLAHFVKGFHSVIPHEIIAELKPEELDLLLCGKSNIDIEE